ncbi:MAG: hypothetical protein O3B87_03985 [bacterium]|nr:hypothetical protein [bacterium]
MNEIRKINYQKFNNYKSDKERIEHLLQYAILAPSTHNSQPWLFKIKKDYCEIHLNPEKKLPQADNLGRDAHISIGCCLENLILASIIYGVYKKHDVPITNSIIARVYFDFNIKKKDSSLNKKLIETMTRRKNMRGPYIDQKVPPLVIKSILQLSRKYPGVTMKVVTSHVHIERIAEITAIGMRMAYNNKAFRNEMSDWFIYNRSSRNEGIPGFTILLPDIISYFFPLIVKYINISSLISFINKKSLRTAPLICSFSAKNNNKKTWVEVGRFAERVMLELQMKQISTSIYVAAIEMGSLSKQLTSILDTKEMPQFLFAAGYMNGLRKFTPRYTVESKTIS